MTMFSSVTRHLFHSGIGAFALLLLSSRRRARAEASYLRRIDELESRLDEAESALAAEAHRRGMKVVLAGLNQILAP